MGMGAEEPWTLWGGERKEALGAGERCRRWEMPLSWSCPGLRRLPVSPANSGNIFRLDQVGLQGANLRGSSGSLPAPCSYSSS